MKATEVMADLRRRFPNEPEYLQAVEEVVSTIEDVYNEYPQFEAENLIERLCIPDRIFSFRVSWVDDKGKVQNNMGYRIQHNNAIGHSRIRSPRSPWVAQKEGPTSLHEARAIWRSCVSVRPSLQSFGVR